MVIKSSLDLAIEHCDNLKSKKLFIIGGGEIYKQAVPFVDEMIITFMNFEAEGEVKFPKINSDDWQIVKINRSRII